MTNNKSTRKTKIVATIGPASSSPEIIRSLIRAGMDVARLNFSHGDHETHARNIAQIRAAARELGVVVGILQDLGGPKIRLGELMQKERPVITGQEVVLTASDRAEGDALPVNYSFLYEDVEVGNRILLADGQVELLVKEKKYQKITCQVVVGGVLTSHKGVNLPTSDLRIQAFTEKDRVDLAFGLEQGVDFVAMSFVRHEKDLQPLKEMMADMEQPPLLIAKIEKPQAVNRLHQILRVVDGLMVARGDLGVEMPLEEVPVIQKMLIRESRRAGRVVITATQMLRSMVSSPRPTRAEVTDVANAVLDGSDAVMLSEESAMGQYPVESVRVLDKVCQYTEPKIDPLIYLDEDFSELLPKTEAAITRAAAALSLDLLPAAISATTTSGSTARLMARFRLGTPVLGITDEERTCRQLALSWGIIPGLIPQSDSVDHLLDVVRKWAADNGMAGPGDRLILTAGVPIAVPGTTNLIKVLDMNPDVEKSQSD